MDIHCIKVVEETRGRFEILEVEGIGTIVLAIRFPPVFFWHAELCQEIAGRRRRRQETTKTIWERGFQMKDTRE